MILLCMAHRAEAKIFIKKMGFKSENQIIFTTKDPAYDNYLLLITGEGILNTLTKLPYYIAKNEIEEIINFGVAGALKEGLELKDIYPVNTIYGYNESILFHTYQSSIKKENALSCISTEKRINNQKDKFELRCHADLVDREIWAIAKVAKEYKVRFHSYKVISDHADESACEMIQEQAEEYSRILFEYFSNLQLIIKSDTSKNIDLPFHASFSHKKRIEKLLNKLAKDDKKDFLQSASKYKNAGEYILALENFINPINQLISAKINKISKPFQIIGADLQFDPKLEKKEFVVKMKINNKRNLDQLCKTIERFDYKEVEDLWNGKLDV